MSETNVKDALMRALHAAYPEGLFWRAGASPYARAGVPDILGVIDGHAIGIEVKKPGKLKNLSPTQERFGKEMIAAGGCWILVDSVELALDLLRGWLVRAYP